MEDKQNTPEDTPLEFLILSNIQPKDRDGIHPDLLRIWGEIENWYGDIKRKESGAEFLKRIQSTYFKVKNQQTPEGKTKFTYFPNHGDDEGNNSWTVCYGEDEVIITAEDLESDAQEVCKRLNEIVSHHQEADAKLVEANKELEARLKEAVAVISKVNDWLYKGDESEYSNESLMDLTDEYLTKEKTK